MALLKEILQQASDGESATVMWSHLRPHLPGETDRLRWFALLKWAQKMQLHYAANDLAVTPAGEITSAELVFWVDRP